MTRLFILLALLLLPIQADARDIWTKPQARMWYTKQLWPIGSNYIPATAINQLEMWQADTFDEATIEKELGWAEDLHMTTMRVFLHTLLCEQDAPGFKRRIDRFLAIAAKHHIKPILVLFDSCWDPEPRLGPHHPPIPGVHNSGWVQAPGRARLADRAGYAKLEGYVRDIVGTFAHDNRVLAWDVWNEPDNSGGGNYPPDPDKLANVEILLPQVFAWTRGADPLQPLTSGVWQHNDWSTAKLTTIESIQIEQSDVISFHDYGWPEQFLRRVTMLEAYGRPILCTEYMARGQGSTFDGSLPVGKARDVGMVNWGFVDGKTQTRLPWDSWKKPYTNEEPQIWFHEVLRADGTPYRAAEADLIRRLAVGPRSLVPIDR